MDAQSLPMEATVPPLTGVYEGRANDRECLHRAIVNACFDEDFLAVATPWSRVSVDFFLRRDGVPRSPWGSFEVSTNGTVFVMERGLGVQGAPYLFSNDVLLNLLADIARFLEVERSPEPGDAWRFAVKSLCSGDPHV